jgi:hypothetical protein
LRFNTIGSLALPFLENRFPIPNFHQGFFSLGSLAASASSVSESTAAFEPKTPSSACFRGSTVSESASLLFDGSPEEDNFASSPLLLLLLLLDESVDDDDDEAAVSRSRASRKSLALSGGRIRASRISHAC